MSKRLQVLLDESELREIQKIASAKDMTVADWVRQVLRAARRGEIAADPGPKLKAINAASRHSFPTADIDQRLQEIDPGYVGRKR